MSGKSPTKDLLSKLREGQEVLWRTIENLKPSEERMAEVQTLLTKRKMDRLSRDSLTIAIDRVDKLPKKRARLRQLSPEYEVSLIIVYVFAWQQEEQSSSTRMSPDHYLFCAFLPGAKRFQIKQASSPSFFNSCQGDPCHSTFHQDLPPTRVKWQPAFEQETLPGR